MNKREFNIGDIVKVRTVGEMYTTYDTMFHIMGFENKVKNYYPDNVRDLIFTIFALDYHRASKEVQLAGIRTSSGLELLIGVRGLELAEEINNTEVKVESKNTTSMGFKKLEVFKTKVIKVNKEFTREVTVAVTNDELGNVYGGYSVRVGGDEKVEGLSEKIALGRALNRKTDLLTEEYGRETQLGVGLDKKYILNAIADSLMYQIDKGIIKIKGVR